MTTIKENKMKNVYWSIPLHISQSKIIKRGITKRRFCKNILSKIFRSIKDYFTETYTIGREEVMLYDFYLETQRNGTLGISKPPKIKENEQLIKVISISIHQSIQDDHNEKN